MANAYLTTEIRVAFWKESAPCVYPVDIAAGCTPIEIVSANIDGAVTELIVDNTAEARAGAVGNRLRIHGRRNGTFEIVCKLHGLGLTTPDGDTAPLTYLAELMGDCWGGVHLSNSTTITGGTSTIPILDSVTNIVPGCLISVEDKTTPAKDYDGFPVCRRVLAVDAGTKAVTLSETIPFAVADGDAVHATATIYHSVHALRDITTNGTYGWYISQGDDVSMQTRLDGCVHNGAIEGFSLGGLMSFKLSGMCANYAKGEEEGLTYIADLGDPAGGPSLTTGLDMTLSIQAVGTPAENLVEASAITFDTGVARSKRESQTPKNYRFHGLAGYSMSPGQTAATFTFDGYHGDFVAGLVAGQRYRCTMTQAGVGAGAGSLVAIHMPNAHITATPGKTAAGDNWGLTVAFEASESSDTTGGSNVDLQKSRFYIALA